MLIIDLTSVRLRRGVFQYPSDVLPASTCKGIVDKQETCRLFSLKLNTDAIRELCNDEW